MVNTPVDLQNSVLLIQIITLTLICLLSVSNYFCTLSNFEFRIAGSWLGLCPGQKITSGKVKSSQTRSVANRAAKAFRMAAFSLTQSRSALGTFYRRLRSRLGASKAITATAHKIARMFYRMWTDAGQYFDPGMDYYEQKYHEQVLNNLRKKAQSLGFDLVAQLTTT